MKNRYQKKKWKKRFRDERYMKDSVRRSNTHLITFLEKEERNRERQFFRIIKSHQSSEYRNPKDSQKENRRSLQLGAS